MKQLHEIGVSLKPLLDGCNEAYSSICSVAFTRIHEYVWFLSASCQRYWETIDEYRRIQDVRARREPILFTANEPRPQTPEEVDEMIAQHKRELLLRLDI